MAKKFDATLKGMLEESPADWARLAGFANTLVDVIDADVSTVTAAADKVLRIRGEEDCLLHYDFQAGPDASLPGRTHCYNALLEQRHNCPVVSVVVILRPEADLRIYTGLYEKCRPGATKPYLRFHYDLIRVWQLPTESLLTGGLGTLPLAPISDVSPGQLPDVLQRMRQQIHQLRQQPRAASVWTSAYVLLGLRYESAFINRLFAEVMGMEESTTYQAIVEKGRQEGVEAMLAMLLATGKKQFGIPAPPQIRTALESVHDLKELSRLGLRLLEVSGWEELLPRSRSRRRRSS